MFEMLVRACGFSQGQYEEAGRVNGRAMEIMERAKGPDYPDLAFILNSKATLLREQVRACFIVSFFAFVIPVREEVHHVYISLGHLNGSVTRLWS